MSGNLTKLKAFKVAGTQVIQSYLSLGASVAPKYINKLKNDILYKKLKDLNVFYTRILRLDEVQAYQDRVVMLQEKLLGVQEKRRNIGQQLTETRKKSTELQDQIHKVKRNDDLQRFLDLMREETEILKFERDINANFMECDREEREVFTAFTNAVRDSHEKQRAQLEYTKYFGLILSILGSFLTFCYSGLRKQDLKNYIEQNLALHYKTPQPFIEQLLNSNEKQVDKVKAIVNVETSAILKSIENNYNAIIQTLDQSDFREMKNSNKALMLLGNNKDRNVTNIVSEPNKVILYGCIAVTGFVILSKLFG